MFSVNNHRTDVFEVTHSAEKLYVRYTCVIKNNFTVTESSNMFSVRLRSPFYLFHASSLLHWSHRTW